jgi:hypothetical protein
MLRGSGMFWHWIAFSKMLICDTSLAEYGTQLSRYLTEAQDIEESDYSIVSFVLILLLMVKPGRLQIKHHTFVL